MKFVMKSRTTRVTIVLQNDLLKKLRTKQSKVIVESQATYSFSRTINDALRKTAKSWTN